LRELAIKDIESIEIVRGPAAATLYGADASAGVIHIITKKGRVGPTRLTHNVAIEHDQIEPNFAPPANYGFCTAVLVAPTSPNPLCRGQAEGLLVSDNPLMREKAFVNGDRNAVSWSVSGGGSNFGYYMSGAFDRENGTTRNNQFDRDNSRVNFNWIPSTKVTLDVNIALVRSEIDLPDSDVSAFGYTGNGLLGSPLTRRDDGVESNNGWANFARDVEAIAKIENTQQTFRTITGATLNIAPKPWFTHRLTVGMDWLRDEVRRFLPRNPRGSYSALSNSGDLSEGRQAVSRYTLDYLTNVRASTGANLVHNISAGTQVIASRDDRVFASGQGLTVNSNDVISAAASRTGGQSRTDQRQVGFLGQWQGSYKDRLFVQLGGRIDGSSAFGTAAQWFALPKAGVSYVVSGDQWWQRHVKFINTLRLRAAYGQAGRAPPAGAALRTMAPTPFLDANGAVQPGAVLLVPGGDSLTAERGVEIEAGLDAGLFNGRVGLELNFYNKTIRNALVFSTLPPSLGYTSAAATLVNVGKIRNRGIELALDAQPIRTRNTAWDFQLTLNTLDSKILDMGGLPGFGSPNRMMVGFQPGVFVAPRIRSVDVANSRVIVSDTAEAIGNLSPSIEGSLTSSVTLLRYLRLSALVAGKGGFYVFNATDAARDVTTPRSQRRLDLAVLSKEERLRRFGDETPGRPAFVREGKVPGAPTTATASQVLEPYYQQGDFLRLREVSLTLTLPPQWSSRLGAEAASLTLAGQNLGLWTRYDGFDPEVFSNGASGISRIDNNTIPQPRRFVARLNIKF